MSSGFLRLFLGLLCLCCLCRAVAFICTPVCKAGTSRLRFHAERLELGGVEISSRRCKLKIVARAGGGGGGKDMVIALTRELGKNDKLQSLLHQKGMKTAELPCIAFEEGEDAPKLPGALAQGGWEYVVVTSPEAADVFLKGWEEAGRPDVTVASVGKATEDALKQGGVKPVFVPSKATGKTLAAELPGPSGSGEVLYPASSRAKTEVQGGLSERGFTVTRLNTYDTVSADWSDEQLLAAKQIDVVTLASPSAVQTWAERVGTHQSAACIGETSAAACRERGFQKIYYPEKPGMDGWVVAVEEAVQKLREG